LFDEQIFIFAPGGKDKTRITICSSYITFFESIARRAVTMVYFEGEMWRRCGMPPKIRVLKAKLRKAGFTSRPGKGSHTVFTHPDLPGARLVLAGSDGDDAQRYQIADVQEMLEKLHDKQRWEERK
jgi:predicted RNA binding protein YcfA (HicA-like mRNA interferase family)